MSLLDQCWRDRTWTVGIHSGKPFPIPPETVDGYRLTRTLGRGGQGRVYRATRLADGRTVAIKFYDGRLRTGESDDDCTDALALKRFQVESGILSSLDHPQLPRCYGTGTYRGRPYYVMEYLRPFKVDDIPVFDDGDDETPLADFLLGLLDVVAYLHQQGIIHQDIKPKNICWKGGKPALIDLGLVYDRHMAAYTTAERLDILARSGGGSPGFCAPEQYGRQEDITELADIFAIGNLINECLQGFHLFQFMLIADRCLNINPARRYVSVSELRAGILNRQRTATADILEWGAQEETRQRRIRSACGTPVHMTLNDLMTRSRRDYDSILTHGGSRLYAQTDGRNGLPLWLPFTASGQHVVVDKPVHFDRPLVVHVCGYGRLEMTLMGTADVVVVLDRQVEFVNHASGLRSAEAYFLNEGCSLVLRAVRSRAAWNRRHPLFQSVHKMPTVQCGKATRDEFIADAEVRWRTFLDGHAKLACILDGLCLIDDGMPVLDLSFEGVRDMPPARPSFP